MAASLSSPPDSLFERQRPEFQKLLLDWRNGLPTVLASSVVDYMVGNENPFGAEEWEKYFGVDVRPEPELPKKFYEVWYGKDPVDRTLEFCATHHPPVLCPRFVTHIATKTLEAYSLDVLGRLVQNPLKGHRSRYRHPDAKALRQHGKDKAGRAYWLVMRKDILARNQPYPQQIQFIKDLNASTGAGYEGLPSALPIATVAFARHALAGKRPLGDSAGEEGRWTFSRCREIVQFGTQSKEMVVGGFGPGGLRVYLGTYGKGYDGIAGLWKF